VAKRSASERVSKLDEVARQLRSEYDLRQRDAVSQRLGLAEQNSVRRFGSHMPQVMEVLDRYLRAGRFNSPPVGPIGMYISVKDDFWAPTVQDVIGALLSTFLVSGQHDMDLLRQVFREANSVGKARIIVLGQHSWARSRYEMNPRDLPQVHQYGHCTVMDMLAIKNDAAFNALVDHCNIERTVLVRGEKAMVEFSRGSGKNDRSVGTCWDEMGSRAYSRNNANTFRPPENKGRGPRTSVLTSDRASHVAQLEAALEMLNHERIAAEDDASACKQHCAQLAMDLRSASNEIKRANQKYNHLLRSKDEFEEQMRAASSEFDSSAFDTAIKSYDDEAKALIKEQRMLEEAGKELAQTVLMHKENEEEPKAVFNQVKAAVLAKTNRVSSLTNDVAKSRAALRSIEKAVTKRKQIVERAHSEISSQRAVYAKVLEDARNLQADRPIEVDDPNQVKSEKMLQDIEAMKRRLRAEEQRRDGKTAEDIEIDYLGAAKQDKENKFLLKKVQLYARSIKFGLAERKTERRGIEHRIKKLVRGNFNEFLKTRGHRGKIKFARNEKTNKPELIISTQMASHKTGDGDLYVTKDLRSLSGGERSYATLAFMLALAEVCQNPVRIMDELDVFMDEASRNAAFQTLVEFCTTHLSERQLVIVTPLTLPTGIIASPSVQIVRLKAVQRPGLQTGQQLRIDQFV
jgi:structural maintenance of chromosomes protein 6